MRAGLCRGCASLCRPFQRARRYRSVADMPCTPYRQASAEQNKDDMGLSPSNLPHLAKRLAFFNSIGIPADGFFKILSTYPQALILDLDTELKVSIALLESALGNILVSECILSWPSLLGVGSSPKESGLGRASVISSRAVACPQRVAVESLQNGAGFDLGSSPGVSSGFSNKESSSSQQASSMQALGLPQQVFASKIDVLLQCGFKKNTKLLAKALHCTLHRSKQDVDTVIHALTSLGLSRNHASRLIKLQPSILQQKPSEITSKLDYILNTLCLSFEDLFKYSSFMLYSLDLHIRPRYLMHGWLKSKRLLRRNFKLDYIMSMSEKQFVCKFVECHEDGVNMYRGFLRNAK